MPPYFRDFPLLLWHQVRVERRLGDPVHYGGTNLVQTSFQSLQKLEDKFVSVRGRADASVVITRKDGAYRFPLFLTKDPMDITCFDYDYLTITEREIVIFLEEFFITGRVVDLDWREDRKNKEYLRKFIIIVVSSLRLFYLPLTYCLFFLVCRKSVIHFGCWEESSLGQKEG